MSKAMGVEVGYHIYLPPSYESSSERFPVLYWLHGAGSDENAGLPIVEMFDKAIEAGQMMPDIMVIPNGGKRSEYRDWEPQKVLPETFIIRELIPYIDANYRTIKDRRGRWIEGMSMGGNGALKFALKFPDLFRLNGLRIRLVAGTMDVALKDSEALHKYFQISASSTNIIYTSASHTTRPPTTSWVASKASASTSRPWNRQGNKARVTASQRLSRSMLLRVPSLGWRWQKPRDAKPRPVPKAFSEYLVGTRTKPNASSM